MYTTSSLFKKLAIAALIVALGLTALPAASASAADLNNGTTPPAERPGPAALLETIWAREQTAYARQGQRLDRADEFTTKVQTLIDRATAKGYDASAVQAALDAFVAVIPAAQAAHDSASGIIASHAGFDENGKMTDRAQAIETVKAVGQALKDTRSAMDGTGKALLKAIQAFREAHRPADAANQQ